MWDLLLWNEKYCRLGFGGNVDSSCKSHLCGVHNIHHLLDGRAALDADAGHLGHRHRRTSDMLSPEVSMGLLVVVLCLCPVGSASVLFHSAAVFLLAHGRLFVGNNTPSEWESERRFDERSNHGYRCRVTERL
mmetsp:Transcript_30789/g.48260  ORF Transcript_30789/g.48260 Transcript_30789/m.48260 type:complete len:133 (+) Transcript_30789:1293-1691(+)